MKLFHPILPNEIQITGSKSESNRLLILQKLFGNIEIKNIERTLDRLSGYYEIKGISSESNESVFRFNISGLRNNYTLSDLTKMDVKLYGIKVGEVDSIDLSFNTMIDRLTNQRQSQLGTDYDEEQNNEKIPIYDVLVAGV